MAAMISNLFLAAVTAAMPTTDGGVPDAGARATGRVAVTILAGARIAAGEEQHSTVPAPQDSSVRAPGGQASAARLVEFH